MYGEPVALPVMSLTLHIAERHIPLHIETCSHVFLQHIAITQSLINPVVWHVERHCTANQFKPARLNQVPRTQC